MESQAKQYVTEQMKSSTDGKFTATGGNISRLTHQQVTFSLPDFPNVKINSIGTMFTDTRLNETLMLNMYVPNNEKASFEEMAKAGSLNLDVKIYYVSKDVKIMSMAWSAADIKNTYAYKKIDSSGAQFVNARQLNQMVRETLQRKDITIFEDPGVPNKMVSEVISMFRQFLDIQGDTEIFIQNQEQAKQIEAEILAGTRLTAEQFQPIVNMWEVTNTIKNETDYKTANQKIQEFMKDRSEHTKLATDVHFDASAEVDFGIFGGDSTTSVDVHYENEKTKHDVDKGYFASQDAFNKFRSDHHTEHGMEPRITPRGLHLIETQKFKNNIGMTASAVGYFPVSKTRQLGITMAFIERREKQIDQERLAKEQKRLEAIAKFSPEMVAIPAGCFMMGSPESEEGRDSTETQHQVCVNAFHIGKYEITRGQFRKFVEATNYITEAERGYGCYIWSGSWGKSHQVNWRDPGFSQGDSHPAVCVSWNDVMAYAEWLSQETGRKYRLPTEAEWEYVARAGTTTAWYWGNNPDQACRYANVGDQDSKSKEWNWILHNCNDGYAITAPVGMFQANDFGVYDMLGNVWEWTCSVYTSSYSGSEKVCVNKNNATDSMAFRGGAWYDAPLRFSNRNKHLASVSGYGMGGRLALDP